MKCAVDVLMGYLVCFFIASVSCTFVVIGLLLLEEYIQLRKKK